MATLNELRQMGMVTESEYNEMLREYQKDIKMSEQTTTAPPEAVANTPPKEAAQTEAKPPEKKSVFLTLQQCYASRSEFERKALTVFFVKDRKWLNTMPTTTIAPIAWVWEASEEKAVRWTYSQLSYWFEYTSLSIVVKPVDQELAERILARKRSFEQMMPNPLQQMLIAAPLNPTARGMVMAHMKIMPPDELKTFEQIKNWVETYESPNLPIVKLITAEQVLAGGYDHKKAEQMASGIAFRINVEMHDNARGCCRYIQRRIGNVNFPVDVDVIRTMLPETGRIEWRTFITNVQFHVQSSAWGYNPVMNETGAREYNNHIHEANGNARGEVNENQLSDHLYEWCRENLTPEQKTSIGL